MSELCKVLGAQLGVARTIPNQHVGVDATLDVAGK